MRSLTLMLDGLFFPLGLASRVAIIAVVLAVIAAIAYYRRMLDRSGIAAALIIGFIVFFIGGVSGFVVFLFFFLSSSVVTKACRGRGKGHPRTASQVVANGLPAALALLSYAAFSYPHGALVAFAAAVAEASADTWAGEIGQLSHKDPVSIVTFTRVPKGISGGVTVLGLSASVLSSLLIAIILFTIMGLTHDQGSTTQEMMTFTSALESKFHITPWLLLVPVITGILIARKVPSVVTLALSTALACMAALLFQPNLLHEVAGGGSLFEGAMMTSYGSTNLQTDNPMLTELVATRGMAGMMNTVWLILCAMCFGGAMTAGGMLGSITSVFVRFIKNRVSTVASTVCSGLFLNLATADQYISIILLGNMFGDIYKKQGYESRLLSRTTEDAVTVTSALIPWNTCGMTQATILSVPTLTYLPFCFFNILSPMMSILIAATGYKIVKKNVSKDNV